MKLKDLKENKQNWTGAQHAQLAKKIAQFREAGMTLATIAKETGVTPEYVRFVLARKEWEVRNPSRTRAEVYKIFPEFLANILVSGGIETISELRDSTKRNQLSKLPGIGKKNVNTVKQWIEDNPE